MILLLSSILFLAAIGLSLKYKGISGASICIAIIFIYAFAFRILPSAPPVDIPLVILAISMATGALECCGGLLFLIDLSEKFISKYPKKITYIGPFIVYFFTILSGSGHTVYSFLNIIAKVSKKVGVTPSKPLAGAVIAAQQGLISSPISSPIVIVLSCLSVIGLKLKDFIFFYIVSTFFSLLITCFFLSRKVSLKSCEIINEKDNTSYIISEKIKKGKLSIIVYFLGIAFIMFAGWIDSIRSLKILGQTKSISMINSLTLTMFLVSAIIIVIYNISGKEIIDSESFKSGLQAAISILGISWLGNVFLEINKNEILSFIKIITNYNEWLFGLLLFFSCIPLMSQSATLKLFLPLGIMLGIDKKILISVIPAVNSVFVLPIYPTMLAAAQLDTSGKTSLGKKFFFNHSFMIPGIIATTISTSLIIVFIKFFYT